MGQGVGFGKVILFNEHFVVYGLPAIASAIGSKTIAHVERQSGSGIKLQDDRPETPGYKAEKFAQQKESLDRMLMLMQIDTNRNHFKITLAGDLIAASGVGASAASCAAIARAFSDELGLLFTDERINEIAYEGEKGYHGTPSGIDNTAATYGGLIWYKREANSQHMERMKLKRPVEIVMGNTGITADTKSVVAGVKERREQEPEKYARIFDEAAQLVKDAQKQLEVFDLKRVGAIMNKNHELLQQIGVSCKELDVLVDLARDNGAFGAKMTGTGRGGYMLALTPGLDLQERVAAEIEKKGFQALRTTIGI
ncbi:MAG: mevalonate kinase [Candidatus Bathyarchaeia archaeon]|jgi:mevalonate kinase